MIAAVPREILVESLELLLEEARDLGELEIGCDVAAVLAHVIVPDGKFDLVAVEANTELDRRMVMLNLVDFYGLRGEA